MKYSVNQRHISSFVVGRAGSEYGLPVAVIFSCLLLENKMVRPIISRKVGYNPEVSYFKPRGIPMLDLEEVFLTVDEREAIRLADLQGLSHEEGGELMGVSRATFGRILRNARRIIADAIISGKAINIQGGTYEMVEAPRLFACEVCSHEWEEAPGTGRPEKCLSCGSVDIIRLRKK